MIKLCSLSWAWWFRQLFLVFVYFVRRLVFNLVSPTTSWLVSVLLWTATKNDKWKLDVCISFNRGQVDCIKQIFLSRYLFLFNYCTIIQCFSTVLYNIDKNMHRYLLPILPVFYLEDYSTKSINKKFYCEHKTLVLTI